MKKILALVLVFVVACATATTTFASENSTDLSVEFDVGAYTVEGTPYRRITYSVTNHGEPAMVKTSLYLDGMLIIPETAEYAVINDRMSESVDVYMPYLTADIQHNLTLKINSSNGYSKEETFAFSALSVKGVDLSSVYKDIPDSVFNITISHLPQLWHAICDTGYSDLTLSGHIHSMQIKIASLSPAALMYEEWTGLYKRDKGYLYINDGIGCVGYLARIGARPEITVIELRCE